MRTIEVLHKLKFKRNRLSRMDKEFMVNSVAIAVPSGARAEPGFAGLPAQSLNPAGDEIFLGE